MRPSTPPSSASVLARVLSCIAAVMMLASCTLAQPLAYVRLDTRALGPAADAEAQRRVVNHLLDWLGPARLVQDDATEGILRDTLAEAVVLARPVTLVVFRAHEPSLGAPVRSRAALRIDAGEHFERFASIVGARLDGAPRGQWDHNGTASFEYRLPAWPEWRSVTLHTEPARGLLDIGLGEARDALVDLRAMPPVLPPAWQLARHRDAVPDAGDAVLECFLDIDQLRHAFPERFGDDAAARVLAAFHLANARSFMVHAHALRRGDAALLSIDATWSVRSESSEVIHRRVIADAAGDDGGEPGVRARVLPDAAAWAVGVLDAYGASLPDGARREFERARRVWTSRRLPLLARIQRAFEPEVLVTLEQERSGVSLGSFTARVALREQDRAEEIARALRVVLDPWEEDIATDDRASTFRLAFPQSSLVRSIRWTADSVARPQALIVDVDLGTGNAWAR